MFETMKAVVGELREPIFVEMQLSERRQSTNGARNARQRRPDDSQRRHAAVVGQTGQQ